MIHRIFLQLQKFFNLIIPGIISNTIFVKKTPKRQAEGMGADLIKYIRDADGQVAAIHDIKIQLTSNLHKYLIESGQIRNEKNKGIKFTIPTDNPNITVNALVYPKIVQLDIGCTLNAFVDDYNGHKQLALLLNLIWQHLCKCSEHRAIIPEPQEWVLTHYHYGKDGQMEYDGEKFHITARDSLGDFIRVYSKMLLDGSIITRIETIKTPKITIGSFLKHARHSWK